MGGSENRQRRNGKRVKMAAIASICGKNEMASKEK
jgi:hypothetical protein